MNLNIKKYVPFMLVLVAILILSGTSYALLKSTSKGSNPYVMNVGVLEISFQDSDEDKLTLVNQIPITDDEGMDSEEEYEFTIKNTGTLPATYSVYIEETSTNPEFKSVIRYITSKNEAEYTAPKTLSEDKYIDTTATLGIDETATYKVKLWLSIDADSTYMNKTFTARIVVDTTLNYDGFDLKDPILGVRLASYEEASLDTFEGGLVAINTDGTLYNENDTTQAIREYRYSGPSVNNYVFFDTNNNGVKEDNEIWRIVGIFKNDADEWNLKLMRNTVFGYEETPNTYTTEDGTTFIVLFNPQDYDYDWTGNTYMWNMKEDFSSTVNDWSTAGLQYWLNATDGYFGTISSKAKTLIDNNYTYYLGNVENSYTSNLRVSATTIEMYQSERGNVLCDSSVTSDSHNNNCNVWATNQAIWQGAISLLYPSDYGYSGVSTRWNLLYVSKSWMDEISDVYDEWLISPSSKSIYDVIQWDLDGDLLYSTVASFALNEDGIIEPTKFRPTLNLLSTAKIENNGADGSENNPYVLVLE